MGTRKPAVPLTPEQRAFAEKNASLIWGYLWKKPPPSCQDMALEDWYTIAAEGYITAVKFWFNKPELQGQYTFSTIAYRCMFSKIGEYMRARMCKCRRPSSGDSISLDELRGDEYKFNLHTAVPDSADIMLDVEAAEEKEILNTAISQLSEREQKIIRMFFFENLTQKEIMAAFGISQPHVSRIKQTAIENLRAYF